MKTPGFTPLHKNHGIEFARVVVILRDRVDSNLGKSILDGPHGLTEYMDSRQIEISSEFGESTSTAETINGFVLQNKKKTRTLHIFHDRIRNILTYTDSAYQRWENFIDGFEAVSKSVTEALKDNPVKALGLEYNDVFNWEGDVEKFKWSELFKKNTDILSKDFHIHSLLKFEVIRERDKAEKIFEQLSITRNTPTRAAILHHLSGRSDNEDFFLQSQGSPFTDKLEHLHKFNKEMLVEILTEEMAIRVGLKTEKP